jgi:hypothetical protein
MLIQTRRVPSLAADCDGISEDRYTELSRDKSSYKCCICRGEVQERLNTFHKKHRTAH